MSATKKRQHFVPQKYLKSWASLNGHLSACINGKIVTSINIINVAQETYFYKYEKLDYDEFCFVIDYLKSKLAIPQDFLQKHITSSYSPHVLRSLFNNEIGEDFILILKKIFKENLFEKSMIDYVKSFGWINKDMFLPTIPREPIFEDTIREGEEELSFIIEEQAWPYFEAALSGDTSFFYTKEGFDRFVLFLIYQLFRTRRFLHISRNTNRFGEDGLRKICSYIRYPLVAQIHLNLLKEREDYELTLINNPTELEFITGDHPLVNLDLSIPTRFWDLYYPLSPNKALFISTRERIKTKYVLFETLTSLDVDYLNKKICSVCSKQVYASNMDTLVRYGYCAGLGQA